MKKTLIKSVFIISYALIIFGVTCLVLSKKEKPIEMRNTYGDTIKVSVEHGELVDAYYGTPIMYCDNCHGILNGRPQYCWNDLKLCEDCNNHFMEKYSK